MVQSFSLEGLNSLVSALWGGPFPANDLNSGDVFLQPYTSGPVLTPAIRMADFTFITNLAIAHPVVTDLQTTQRQRPDNSITLDCYFPPNHQPNAGALPQKIKGFALVYSTLTYVLAACDLDTPLALTTTAQTYTVVSRLVFPSFEFLIDLLGY